MTKRSKPRRLQLELPADLTTEFFAKINSLGSSVRTDYLKKEIASKFVSDQTDSPFTRRTRAINKWLATERDNEATGDRLLITPGEYNILPRVRFDSFVRWCQDLVIDIIGETAPLEALIGTFSGGASTSRSRTSSHPAGKYTGEAHATQSALELFVDTVADELPLWINAQHGPLIKVVSGNVLFTVPKKTDIDRVACKEPDLNMFLQKGIGSHFRGCLRRIGINLNDQSINRSLARVGSIDGSLATLDLSSASDSVSTELVQLFLPECWYTLLDSVRCPITVIDGQEHRNQMFSSMGNGFTFELESLLFYVLARAVSFFRGVPGKVSVYGDDIICPTESAGYLEWVLNYFGFQVNPDKSFSEGPFRESCGGHYHNGTDITPFYVRRPITLLPDLIDVANKLRWWGRLEGISVFYCDPEVHAVWCWLKSYIPECLWGGVDYTFKYQLVSDDQPSLRIAEEMETKTNGIGGYLQWHNTTWDRAGTSDGVTTSSRSRNLGKYRLRPVRKYGGQYVNPKVETLE